MVYVVGTISMDMAGNFGLAGTLHAVRIEQVYAGIAVCGAEIYPWSDIEFPTGRPNQECTACQAVVHPTFVGADYLINVNGERRPDGVMHGIRIEDLAGRKSICDRRTIHSFGGWPWPTGSGNDCEDCLSTFDKHG